MFFITDQYQMNKPMRLFLKLFFPLMEIVKFPKSRPNKIREKSNHLLCECR
jgi:hypothetical protein